jgi:hypothetical protein
MSLTGSLFLWVLVAVTVGAFVAVVLAWPALAGRGVSRVGGRVGMLVLLNALVLVTAGALLNAQFLFFADWSDLRGAFGGVPTSTAVSRVRRPAGQHTPPYAVGLRWLRRGCRRCRPDASVPRGW